MGAEQQVGPVADRFADRRGIALGEVEALERRLAAVVDGVGAGRVELDGGEALLDGGDGGLCGECRVGIEVRPALGGVGVLVARVQVGVGAQRLVDPASQQVVDRASGLLADDVPTGDLEGADHAAQRRIRPRRVAAAVGPTPEGLHVEGALAYQPAVGHVLDHLGDQVWSDGGHIGLADSLDAAVGRERHEDEVAATVPRRRIADDERLDLVDHHPSASLSSPGVAWSGEACPLGRMTVRRTSPRRTSSKARSMPSRGWVVVTSASRSKSPAW